MDHVPPVRVRQRQAHLAEDVHDALGRQGPEAPHQLLQVHAVEQLHDVVERAVLGRAVSRRAARVAAMRRSAQV
ncbi:MAG: hypothetical protein A2W29_11590 [Gemmatimonadetes bacterium RBG_16_66_8]|nr:MAG: hypothetical protein A2W29_11590 [Gemmatimonadetes bacterium RBG_16_66_8]